MSSIPSAPIVDQIVLVVDNDPAVRASLQFVLEIDGFVVCAFETGEALLACNVLPQKACVIVDFSLPRMNGFELITALHDRGWGAVRIIETPGWGKLNLNRSVAYDE